jgi:Ca2+/H+ antiporter
MEITDNAVVMVIPGAMNARMVDALFWIAMALSLIAAFIVAYPVNRFLLARGKGHALTHAYHHDDDGESHDHDEHHEHHEHHH